MKRILPSWWRSAATVIALSALACVLLWKDKSKLRQGQSTEAHSAIREPDQKRSGETEEKERIPPIVGNARMPGASLSQADTPISETIAPGLARLSIEERIRKLTERRDLTQQLRKQSAGDLLNGLTVAWSTDGHSGERTTLMTALIQTLQVSEEHSREAAYKQFSLWLKDGILPFAAKSDVASILGSVQTPQSIQLLLEEYQQASDESLRGIFLKEIAKTGDFRWAAGFHEELSPALETAWRSAKDDPKLAEAIALGLAKVGAPMGVNLLVSDIVGYAQTLEGMSDLKEPPARAAAAAIDKVRNPNAIDVLTTSLLSPDASKLQRYVCGISLAAMGNVDATRTLVQWALTAPDEEAAWAERWFGKLRDTASFEFVANVLSRSSQVEFTSLTVRSNVARGLQNR